MAFPQTKTPLSPTVRKRQRRINSSAVPLLLPVQSPAPQCASNNARPVITGACRSRLLGRIHRPFSRKARRGSSHGRPALPCTIRQLSAAFFPGTLSRHSRIFHCHGVYSSAGSKSRKTTLLVFHPAHAKSEAGSCNGCLRDPVTEKLTRKCYHIATGNTNNIPMEDLNMKAKFYICEHCGDLVTTIHNAGVPLLCCGEKMKELLPNTVEASGVLSYLNRK